MADRVTPERRSFIMSKVGQKDTKPEMILRRALHARGYRYRLHRRDLPGTPDLVFHSRRKVIFVHGCFWHGHDCSKGRRPTSNVEFWNEKLDRNLARDTANITRLRDMGWQVLVVWECEMGRAAETLHSVEDFLDGEAT